MNGGDIMAINERLKKLRTSRGLSQSEMADKLGVSLSSYQKYERDKGSVTPSLDVLVRIADYYDVSVDYLLGRANKEQTELDELIGQFNMGLLEKKIVENYLSLEEKMRGQLMDYLEKAVKEVAAESAKIAESNNQNIYLKASRSADDRGPEIVTLTPEQKKRLDEAPDETKNPDNDI